MALPPADFAGALPKEARETHPWLDHPLFRMIYDGELSRAQLQNVIRQQGCFFLDTLRHGAWKIISVGGSTPTWEDLEVPAGTRSQKVRAAGGLMLVNREAQLAHQPPPGTVGGLGIYDVSNPSRRREIAFWQCGGAGVHRFTFDGRYAYISPEMDGYVGNIVMILDLADPHAPRETAHFLPETPDGHSRVSSNDVDVDDRGLHVLEKA